MNSNKRRRGRPIGTGLNDAPILNKIADLIMANPTLRPTTAIRRCVDKPGPSYIRRLQVKWKAGAAEYLAQAQKRHVAALAPAPARRARGGYTPHSLRQIMEAQRKMEAMLGSPTMRAIRDLHDNPTLRAVREFYDNPTMRAMRELHDSPTMRAIREMQDSPATRAMCEVAEEIAKVQRLFRGTGF